MSVSVSVSVSVSRAGQGRTGQGRAGQGSRYRVLRAGAGNRTYRLHRRELDHRMVGRGSEHLFCDRIATECSCIVWSDCLSFLSAKAEADRFSCERYSGAAGGEKRRPPIFLCIRYRSSMRGDMTMLLPCRRADLT